MVRIGSKYRPRYQIEPRLHAGVILLVLDFTCDTYEIQIPLISSISLFILN